MTVQQVILVIPSLFVFLVAKEGGPEQAVKQLAQNYALLLFVNPGPIMKEALLKVSINHYLGKTNHIRQLHCSFQVNVSALNILSIRK